MNSRSIMPWLVITAASCTPGSSGGSSGTAASAVITPTSRTTNVIVRENVERLLTALAHDSMEGRRAGTAGSARAARMLAHEMRRMGLEPGAGNDFLQTVPMVRTSRADGIGLRLLMNEAALDSVPQEQLVLDANVIGLIRGSDPDLRDEAVIVGAHYDHVGIGEPVTGDSIYNGADDDASGTIAVLEIARAMKAGPSPARTVVFAAFTAEESGLLGTHYYIAHPAVPMERTVADLQIEMIGRPDPAAGGAGKGWLTGYERSTMGDMLREHEIPLIPDPRPEQNFFMRSDNVAFARIGIPAHTLSSYNMHGDYHRPSDDVSAIDFDHMTAVIRAAAQAVRVLADGEAPRWHPGGRPGH